MRNVEEIKRDTRELQSDSKLCEQLLKLGKNISYLDLGEAVYQREFYVEPVFFKELLYKAEETHKDSNTEEIREAIYKEMVKRYEYICQNTEEMEKVLQKS